MSGRPPATAESTMNRFFAKVDMPAAYQACWPWSASVDRKGYGKFNYAGGRALGAHRYSYATAVGPIPDGMQIDHLCRNPSCVNPLHLEPVTPRENTMRSPIAVTAVHSRKSHCKRGHEFTPENTQPTANGRQCRVCARMLHREWAARRGKRS